MVNWRNCRAADAPATRTALNDRLLVRHGPFPFEPVEPATLRLVPAPLSSAPKAGEALQLATLCAPRGLGAGDATVVPPIELWVLVGALFRFEVAVAANEIVGLAHATAMREARAQSLVDRLRVTAALHSVVSEADDATSRVTIRRVPLATRIEPSFAAQGQGDCATATGSATGALVVIALPPAEILPSVSPGRWILRVERASLASDELALGSLSAGVPVVKVPPRHEIFKYRYPEAGDTSHTCCLVCTACFNCTGYGAGCCMNAGRCPRPLMAGKPCGCGAGTPGCNLCAKCAECCSASPYCDKAAARFDD